MIECPGCGGNVKFSIADQMMKCDYCDEKYSPYFFDKKDKDAQEVETFEATVYICPQCGGELITESDNEVTSFCSFCGASDILFGRMRKEKRPNRIIPFKLTKEDCKEAYLKRAKKAIYAPKGLRDKKYIDSFRGIYMPFWSYKISHDGDMEFWGTSEERKGDYIYESFYKIGGHVSASYDGIDYDASAGFADDISSKIVPYNQKDAGDFSPAFLSGFYAEAADVDAFVYEDEAGEFANDSTYDFINKSDVCSGVTLKDSEDIKKSIPESYRSKVAVMYPVWFMSYRNNDRVVYATVNAQTGKVAADFPMDIGKYLLGTGIGSLVLFAILNLFLTMKPLTAMIFVTVALIIAGIVYMVENSAIKSRNSGENDKGLMAKAGRLAKKNSPNAGKKEEQVKGKIKDTTEDTTEDTKSGMNIKIVIGWVCFIASVLVWFVKPVMDSWYYGICIASSIAIVLIFADIIKMYNEAASRPLPQFKKSGGDDNA